MKEIQFDVDLTIAELYAFSMRHTYFSVSGIVGLLISIGSLLIVGIRYSVLDQTTVIALVIIGLLFTVVQPIMLYFKARSQRKQNESINAPLHYTLSEEGIGVSQGEQTVQVKWYEVRKKIRTRSAYYLYMSPVRAFIFPKTQCDGKFEEIGNYINNMMEKYRDYEEPEKTLEETEEQTDER